MCVYRVRCNRTIASVSIDAHMYEVRCGRTFIDRDAIAICADARSARVARNLNKCAFARIALR